MIQDMLRRKFGIRCKAGTLRRALKKIIRFSYRKPRPVPYNAATPEEQERFKNDVNHLVNEAAREGFTVLSCEQMHARLRPDAGYGWRATNGHDTIKIGYSRQSGSIVSVLDSDSLHIRTVDACNSKIFKGFLRGMLRIYHKILLILDNASYHYKSATVTNFVGDNKGRLRLVFLPAHTPQLNPIEQQWNVLKRLLAGRYFASVGDLRAAIAAIARRRMRPVKMMNYLTVAQ